MSKTLEQKDSIIEKNLEISWFLKASIESFLVSGKPSGTFRSNLHKIMEEYATECIKASLEKANKVLVVDTPYTIGKKPEPVKTEGKETCKWEGNLDACGNETCWDLQVCQRSPKKVVEPEESQTETCVIETNRWTKTRRIFPVIFTQQEAEDHIKKQSTENSTFELFTISRKRP